METMPRKRWVHNEERAWGREHLCLQRKAREDT